MTAACFAAAFAAFAILDIFRHNGFVTPYDYAQFVLATGWLFASWSSYRRMLLYRRPM